MRAKADFTPIPFDGFKQTLIATQIGALTNERQHPHVDLLVLGLECPQIGLDRLVEFGNRTVPSLQVSACRARRARAPRSPAWMTVRLNPR